MDRSESKPCENLVFYLPNQLRYSVSSCTAKSSTNSKQSDHRNSPAQKLQLRKTLSDGITAKFLPNNSSERSGRTLLLYSGFSVPEGGSYGQTKPNKMEAGDTISKTSLHRKNNRPSSREESVDWSEKPEKPLSRTEKYRQRLEEREKRERRERRLERENVEMEEKVAKLHWQQMEKTRTKEELEKRVQSLQKKHATLAQQTKKANEVRI